MSPAVGLCATCQYVREVRSDRGSVFYRCVLSAQDPVYPKYPRLPVLRCPGWTPPAPAQEPVTPS